MSRERRFLVEGLETEERVCIRGDEAHHLLHVLKLGPGDEVTLFDGRGRAFRAVVEECRRAEAFARKVEAVSDHESPLALAIGIALPKGDAMTRVVRQLTELGVYRILPVRSERTSISVSRGAEQRLSRWRRVAIEACKQSGRSRVPDIEPPLSFDQVVSNATEPERVLLSPSGSELPQRCSGSSCLALVGPEGGWTEREERFAREHGFRTVRMGPRTLRSDTAALVAGALLARAWGDLGGR